MKSAIIKLLKHVPFLYHPLKHLYGSCRNWLLVHSFIPLNVYLLVISVGQACNYKCKNCGNFAPYAPSEFMRYKLEDIKSSLTRLLKAVNRIDNFQIQGGEPFVYSELGNLVKFLRNFTVGGGGTKIVIATNGSILPNNELLKILKDSNVHVSISDYNVTPDKTQKLIEVLKQWGISHSVYSFASHKSLWYYLGGINTKDYPCVNDDVVSKRYNECEYRGCLTLERGQLARCSRANNAPFIQGFTAGNDDYFVLSRYSDKELRKECAKYYCNPKPMEACRYCYGSDHSRMIPPAEQL